MNQSATSRVSVALMGITFLATSALDAAEPSKLVAEGAKVQKLAGGFKFTEGPACDAAG